MKLSLGLNIRLTKQVNCYIKLSTSVNLAQLVFFLQIKKNLQTLDLIIFLVFIANWTFLERSFAFN